MLTFFLVHKEQVLINRQLLLWKCSNEFELEIGEQDLVSVRAYNISSLHGLGPRFHSIRVYNISQGLNQELKLIVEPPDILYTLTDSCCPFPQPIRLLGQCMNCMHQLIISLFGFLNTDVSTTMIVQPGPVMDFLVSNQNVPHPDQIDWVKVIGSYSCSYC